MEHKNPGLTAQTGATRQAPALSAVNCQLSAARAARRAIQPDLFAQSESVEALVTRRLPVGDLLLVSDVASALNITRTKVIELMEQGLIKGVNLNLGSNRRPFYKITRDSVLAYARRLEQGI